VEYKCGRDVWGEGRIQAVKDRVWGGHRGGGLAFTLHSTVFYDASNLMLEIVKQQNLARRFALVSRAPNSAGDSSPLSPVIFARK